MKIHPRAQEALSLLERAGFDAYLVGGCIRDNLIPLIGSQRHPFDFASFRSVMDCAPSDWDIVTNATPSQIQKCLGGRILRGTDRSYETVFTSMDGAPIKATTYRGRATTIEEDLAKRDFTINAIARDTSGHLIDPFGGTDDIRSGLLRAVGNPVQRFREDELRILRGLRFAAVFGWEIEDRTAAVMHAERGRLSNTIVERINAELTKILCGTHVSTVLRQFRDVLSVVVPDIEPTVGFSQNNSHHHLDVWEHTLAVVQAAPAVPALRLAALLHDLGKPACYTVDDEGRGHFYGHAERSAEIAQKVMSHLRFSDDLKRRVVTLVEHHGDILTDAPSRRTVRRMVLRLGRETFSDLLALRRADIAGHRIETCGRALATCKRFEEIFAELEAEESCFSLKDLAVRGGDIMELGYRGPEVGEKLRELLEAVVEERVPNEREALMWFLNDKTHRQDAFGPDFL